MTAPTASTAATSSSAPGTTCGCTSPAWAGTGTAEVPIIVRGDGCYLEDSNGKRYLDALAGLFSVNIGYGYGEEIGQAALEQMRELPFYTNWSYAHPKRDRARRRGRLARARRPEPRASSSPAARRPSSRPGSWRGSTTLPAAASASRRRHGAKRGTTSGLARRRLGSTRRSRGGSPTTGRRWARSRSTASPRCAKPFEPLVPEVRHVANTNRYHRPPEETEEEFTRLPARRPRARRSSRWGRRPSASCTWSRCRTRAARSRRRRATGRACASSATATTSCSPPTR